MATVSTRPDDAAGVRGDAAGERESAAGVAGARAGVAGAGAARAADTRAGASAPAPSDGGAQPGGSAHPPQPEAAAQAVLPGDTLAPSAARTLLRATLGGWGLAGPAVEDVALLATELVTNAVVHAGTQVVLGFRREGGGLVVEVADRHPTRVVEARTGEGGHHGNGLRLVAALTEEWGVSYRRDGKTVWFRLGWQDAADPVGAAVPAPAAASDLEAAPAEDGAASTGAAATPAARARPDARTYARTDARPAVLPPGGAAPASHAPVAPRVTGCYPARPGPGWASHGALSFLAEASDLLAGQTSVDCVASLACQLLVPRFADWCAVWLVDEEAGPAALRLARAWHASEDRVDALRAELAAAPPALAQPVGHGAPADEQAVPYAWPGRTAAYGPGGAAAACRLAAGGRTVGVLTVGSTGLRRIPDEVLGVIEDFARRVALAVRSARRYTRQATISQVLQRGLLPSGEVAIPGVDTAVVYEPVGEGAAAGGDFYDFFAAGEGRWRFALGDVCGNGPEAAVVTGLARPVLRLLAREGYAVPQVLDRLNREVGEQTRFLSLLYGELAPLPPAEGAGLRCTVASAGHPLPLLLDARGAVRAAAAPQLLLGVVEDARYVSQSFTMAPGDTLLCVTDGVTERRSGRHQLDDGDGLAAVLRGCAGLDAAATARRVRDAVHAFAPGPLTDDLALLVLKARPPGA